MYKNVQVYNVDIKKKITCSYTCRYIYIPHIQNINVRVSECLDCPHILLTNTQSFI